jgi:quercetin dioxygenase-like cupin family protein
MLFDNQTFAVMAVSHEPNSVTPDMMADKDSDRVLVLTSGDLALQIGATRYRLTAGDAVQITRGTRFGNAQSRGGAQMLLIRSKPARSFTLIR